LFYIGLFCVYKASSYQHLPSVLEGSKNGHIKQMEAQKKPAQRIEQVFFILQIKIA